MQGRVRWRAPLRQCCGLPKYPEPKAISSSAANCHRSCRDAVQSAGKSRLSFRSTRTNRVRDRRRLGGAERLPCRQSHVALLCEAHEWYSQFMNTSDDFRPVLDLVEASPMSDGVKRTLTWCLGQLPPLYDKFAENHDVFFSEKIAGLEKSVFRELGKGKKNTDTQKLSDDVLAGLKAIHEKHGLQSLDPRPAKPAVPRRKLKVPVAPAASVPPTSSPGLPGV